MHILRFTVDEVQELIGSGDHTALQQIWVEKDGEVRIMDPSGLYPSEADSTLYARSHIFQATENAEQSYVGNVAANDPKVVGPAISGLLEAQSYFTSRQGVPSTSEFWI
jgi:hypothetical protein